MGHEHGAESRGSDCYLLVEPARSVHPGNHVVVKGRGAEQTEPQSRSPRLPPAKWIDHRNDQPSGKNRGMVTRKRWVIEINERPIPERVANYPTPAGSVVQVAAAIGRM